MLFDFTTAQFRIWFEESVINWDEKQETRTEMRETRRGMGEMSGCINEKRVDLLESQKVR